MHNQAIERKGKRDRRTDRRTDRPTDMCKAIYPVFFKRGHKNGDERYMVCNTNFHFTSKTTLSVFLL